MKQIKCLVVASLCSLLATAALAQELRVGVQDDIDTLDPHKQTTFVGRMILTSICDKLVDIDASYQVVPQLAKSWSWSADGKILTFNLRDDVTFHDGSHFDATAAKANLDRAVGWSESRRKLDLYSIQTVEAPSATTLQITLKQPDVTLLAQMADRAGMMLSPASFSDQNQVGRQPSCSGAYKFSERVQNDRIVLTKFDGYYDQKEFPVTKLTFRPIGDATVRLANLRSGNLDVIERANPTDLSEIKADSRLRLAVIPGIGYVQIAFNFNNGPRARDNPFADRRIRQAFQLVLDRDAINEVAGAGIFAPAQQPWPPGSPYHSGKFPNVERNIKQARALLKEAGLTNPKAEILFPNTTTHSAVMEMVQAMAAEAGFEIGLRPLENAVLSSEGAAGNFHTRISPWSGRYDPDGNISQYISCKGALNDGKYCNPKVDKLLSDAKGVADVGARKKLYENVLTVIEDELPVIYLYYPAFPFVTSNKITGFAPLPDGVFNFRNVRLSTK